MLCILNNFENSKIASLILVLYISSVNKNFIFSIINVVQPVQIVSVCLQLCVSLLSESVLNKSVK